METELIFGLIFKCILVSTVNSCSTFFSGVDLLSQVSIFFSLFLLVLEREETPVPSDLFTCLGLYKYNLLALAGAPNLLFSFLFSLSSK